MCDFRGPFKVEEKLIVEAVKSPIVLGLEATGALIWNTKQKPDPLENRAFANGINTTAIEKDSTVIISPTRGAHRELNPN